jgi:hypothetical protein
MGFIVDALDIPFRPSLFFKMPPEGGQKRVEEFFCPRVVGLQFLGFNLPVFDDVCRNCQRSVVAGYTPQQMASLDGADESRPLEGLNPAI